MFSVKTGSGAEIRGPSQREVLLKAASGLTLLFGRTALVVAAWRESQDLFGLPGFEAIHPCSHRVQSVLYGRSGPLARGEMGKLEEKFFITDAGRLAVEGLDPPDSPTREVSSFARMRISRAYELFDSGKRDQVDERMAEAFWGMPLDSGLADVEARTRKLLNGRERPDERLVGACHDWLIERFKRQLTRTIKR